MIFWATLVTGLPGGYLADRYGPKKLLILSMFLHIIGTIVFPYSALNAPYYVTLSLRFVFGLGLVSGAGSCSTRVTRASCRRA